MGTYYEIIENGTKVARMEDQKAGMERIQTDDTIFFINDQGKIYYYPMNTDSPTFNEAADILLQYKMRHVPANEIRHSVVSESIDRINAKLKSADFVAVGTFLTRKELYAIEKAYSERGYYTEIKDNWDDSSKLILKIYK